MARSIWGLGTTCSFDGGWAGTATGRPACGTRQAPEATEALAQWLDALGAWATAFDGLPEPLRVALDEQTSPLALTCQGFVTTTDEFLTAAQEAGGARPGMRGRDLFLGVLAVSWVGGAAMADESSTAALNALLRGGWELPQTGSLDH